MNKRRFRRSLKQNAIYYKVKRVLTFEAPSGTDTCRMGINFNGMENPTDSVQNGTALWYQTESTAAVSHSLGDLPDLSGQYDQNRLAGVSLKWYPGMPNGSVAAQYSPMAICWDRDGIEGDVLTSDLPTLMEQVNGVSIKNAYRPWKRYFKAPKYSLNTRIPTNVIAGDQGMGYSPNENLAGQWKRVGLPISTPNATFQASMTIARERGTHLLVNVEAPSFSEEEAPGVVGTMVITSYFVYKDRR